MSARRNDQQLARRFARKADWRQGGLCFWCRVPMTLDTGGNMGVCSPTTMTAEHLVPVWAGGLTTAGNIVAACYTCNNTRSYETNRSKNGNRYSVGDDTLVSPFAELSARLAAEAEQERRRREQVRWLTKSGELDRIREVVE